MSPWALCHDTRSNKSATSCLSAAKAVWWIGALFRCRNNLKQMLSACRSDPRSSSPHSTAAGEMVSSNVCSTLI